MECVLDVTMLTVKEERRDDVNEHDAASCTVAAEESRVECVRKRDDEDECEGREEGDVNESHRVM